MREKVRERERKKEKERERERKRERERQRERGREEESKRERGKREIGKDNWWPNTVGQGLRKDTEKEVQLMLNCEKEH